VLIKEAGWVRNKWKMLGSKSGASSYWLILALLGKNLLAVSGRTVHDLYVMRRRLIVPYLICLQSGVIEQGATLLQLQDTDQFNTQILVQAARHSQENDRIPEAIKLYNLAGEYSTVISCLAQALGNTVAQLGGEGEKGRAIERTATDIMRHYERTNRAVGKDRDAVIRLLRIRDALDAKNAGRAEVALEVRTCSIHPSCMLMSFGTDHGINRAHPAGG
jgi:hypothetical protein